MHTNTEKHILITKADGDQEPFDISKLEFSLKRAGASEDVIELVSKEIDEGLVPGETTSSLYKRAFDLLKKYQQPTAARYSLKRAVFDLGPTGFPFEDFIAEIFKRKGYKTETRILIDGQCTVHEVDVLLEKDGKKTGIEVKFHNNAGLKSDLKVALYVKARFDDILAHGKSGITDWCLITNTKFTSQALDYGLCAGLSMISWSEPMKGNLQDLIEETNVHPLTCLTSLSQQEKQRLMEDRIVLCSSLPEHVPTLKAMGLSDEKINITIHETEYLCRPSL